MNCNNGNQMVQDHIGDAYDIVLAVYNSLSAINGVDDNRANIQAILDNLAEIRQLGTHIPVISNVNNHMDAINAINASIAALTTLNDNHQDYLDATALASSMGQILAIRATLNRIANNINAGEFKGEKGDDGEKGDTGSIGLTGATGAAGTDGDNLSLQPSVASVGLLPLDDDAGTLRVVRNNSHIYKWDGTTWIDLGIFANGEKGTSLTGRDRAVHLGDLPLAVDGAEDGDVRVVYEDGHQYTYHAPSDSWTDMGQFLIQYKTWVADFAALPVVGNSHHDVRGTEDTTDLYAWDDVSGEWRLLGNLASGGANAFSMATPVAVVADLPNTDNKNTARYVIATGETWVVEPHPTSGVATWINKGVWHNTYNSTDFEVAADGSVSLKKRYNFNTGDFTVDASGEVSLKDDVWNHTFATNDFNVSALKAVSLKNKKSYNTADFTDIGNIISIKDKLTYRPIDFEIVGNELRYKGRKTFDTADFNISATGVVTVKFPTHKTFDSSDFDVSAGNVVSLKNDPNTFKAADFNISAGGEVSLANSATSGNTFDAGQFNVIAGAVSLKNVITYKSTDFTVTGNELAIKDKITYAASDFEVVSNELRLKPGAAGNTFRATDFDVIAGEVQFKDRKTFDTDDFTDIGNAIALKADPFTFNANDFVLTGADVTLKHDYRPKMLDSTNRLFQLFRYASAQGSVASGTTLTTGVVTKTLNAGANTKGFTHVRIKFYIADQLDDADGLIINALARTYINGVRESIVGFDSKTVADDGDGESVSSVNDTLIFPVTAGGNFTFTYEVNIYGGTGTGNITNWATLLRAYPIEYLFMQ